MTTFPFKDFESKPITRQAFQIKPDVLIKKTPNESEYEAHVIVHGDPATAAVARTITFKAYEEPQQNDWIVRLTETDTYHVTDKVFRERNIVND
jgi:hypothetical protein